MAWQEKDISTWSKKSLPEYLFALQELKLLSPCRCTSFDIGRFVQEGPCLLLTPWSHMEVRFSHIEVSGEVCLCGRKSEVLQFDLDIGVQLDIFKAVRFYQGPKREEPFFRGVLRIFHFEPNSIPEIQANFDRADAIMAEAAEVTWFLQKGMGSRLLLASLSRAGNFSETSTKDCSEASGEDSPVSLDSADALVFFDWDDTLLPTSWISQQGWLNADGNLVDRPDEIILSREQQVLLQELEVKVEHTLLMAMRYGRVVIVTNAADGWVEMSCAAFMPGLRPLLDDIDIISARSSYEPGQQQLFDLEY
eukprot:g14753.t2